MLLNKILNKILKESNLEKCFKIIIDIKEFLDNYIIESKKYLILEIKKVFDKGYKGELKIVLGNWYNDLSEDNIEYLYDISVNFVLKLILEILKKNDDYIIEKLVKIVIGLSIEDW